MSLTEEQINQNPKSIEGLEALDQTWDIDYKDLEFESELARGNFGAVLRANYLGTQVAVKRLFDMDDDMKIYLQRELNVLKQIRHPNIVQFLGLAKDKKGLYLVTEFVPRGDLCKLLYDRREVELKSWKLRLQILIESAQALAFVHAKNLIHRDIKAANYLVGDNWHVKLCDFGFSRSLANAKAGNVMTLCGTDEWMAPEVIMSLDYNQSADVFSFGMFIMEVITRSEPEPRDPGKAFRFNERRFQELLPSSCPKPLASLITDKCTQFKPADRPSMKEVLKALVSIDKKLKDVPSSGSGGESRRKTTLSGSGNSSKDKSISKDKSGRHKKEKSSGRRH